MIAEDRYSAAPMTQCLMLKRKYSLTTDQPNVETLTKHVGANDPAKQKSEILKIYFTRLLNTNGKLKLKKFIAGPVLTTRCGNERHSRLLMVHKWSIKTCPANSQDLLRALASLWTRRTLYEAKLFTANFFHFHNKNSNELTAKEEQAQGRLSRMQPTAYQEHTIPKQ